ncbi:DM13 domain-containing protein [Rhodocytophaga rosea]|uniref:DM13 domain-containing protein n=1 Tax=Rhodocytophaga rosea TaxID=2704465 RepID=A0A6C0GUA1_9BACT|nr:DM13 domain-containing protein [Rhodocytophaga rosea]QHT71781.1 DM13 domain-containing protein [Rhodocytophaga rosea]
MRKKYIFLLLAGILMLAACKQDEPAPVVEMLDLGNDTLQLTGMFQQEVHATSGTVKMLRRENDQLLVLENFKTDYGPSLYVYLSKDRGFTQSLNLGLLKSTSGTFSYEVAATVDTREYPYVLIWCRQFAVLFGSARLETPQ